MIHVEYTCVEYYIIVYTRVYIYIYIYMGQRVPREWSLE